MEKEARFKIIKIIVAIIVVIILLISIKACRSSENIKDDNLIKQDFEQIVVETPIESHKEYVDKLTKYEGSASSTLEELVYELDKMKDPFECNEDTSLVYRKYSDYFESIAKSYSNLIYVGDESIGEIDYLTKRFEYYDNLSRSLSDISKAMDRNDSVSVLSHYDEMGDTLKVLYGNGEVRSEKN